MRAAIIGWFAAAGCATSNDPCQEYVDYVCNCHDGEPGYDCAEMQATYADPDPDVQDQCQIDLAALQKQDREDGVVCPPGTGAG